jgi:hypothetical protein
MRHELLAIAALAVGFVAQAHGETIRCGSSVVDESVTVEELVSKCGQPASKRYEEQDIRVRTPNDLASNTRKVGTTVTEYWTYDRGSHASPVLVTISDGKIRAIKRNE